MLLSRIKVYPFVCQFSLFIGMILPVDVAIANDNKITQGHPPRAQDLTALQSTARQSSARQSTSLPSNDGADNQQRAVNAIASSLIKIPAHLSIFSAELIATEAAEKELEKFRRGEHDGAPTEFAVNSPETQELLAGNYYQELTQHLIEETAKWYGGKIPHSNGLFSQANTFRPFGGKDFLNEIVDGIDMADIIGSITYYVRVTTQDGYLYFHAINKMSLGSYAGEHYFEHDLVNNPTSGSFTSTAQVFNWRVEIPERYRQ